MRLEWNVILVSLVVMVGSSPLMAQSGAVSEDFENGIEAWTIIGGGTGVTWAADGTPAAVPGGAADMGVSSLNYNNGVDYAGLTTGAAISPVFPLSAEGKHTLVFQCNFETETDDATWGFDVRQITITPGNGAAITELLGVINAGATVGPCLGMGSWHQHEIELDGNWESVQVEFYFDSVDDLINDYSGWFVDGFTITGDMTTKKSPTFGSNRDNDNGDHTINDTLCGGSLAMGYGNAFLLTTLLAGLALFAFPRRRR